MDVLTKEQRRKNMQAIRSRDTKAERKLGKALWAKNYRYRKNDKSVFGKPDFTFKRLKIAIFVDGEYFHGKNWKVNKHRIKTNRKFWWAKIEGNIRRDREVIDNLTNSGWKVLRFWDTRISQKLGYCIAQIEKSIKYRKNAQKIF